MLGTIVIVVLTVSSWCVGRQELENFRAGQAMGQTIIITSAAGSSGDGSSIDGGEARGRSGQWWRPKGWQVRSGVPLGAETRANACALSSVCNRCTVIKTHAARTTRSGMGIGAANAV